MIIIKDFFSYFSNFTDNEDIIINANHLVERVVQGLFNLWKVVGKKFC